MSTPGGSPGPRAGDGVESESVGSFLAALASGSPAPGGGSAAALAGALAAALVAMVCRVTAEREVGAAGLAGLALEADALRQRLARLVSDDAAAYQAVLTARRLPAEARPAASEAALRKATEAPLASVAAAGEVLALCDRAAAGARMSTLGDLRVAGLLAGAALEAGAVTARINLRDMTDTALAGLWGEQLGALLAEGRARGQHVAEAIEGRTGRLL